MATTVAAASMGLLGGFLASTFGSNAYTKLAAHEVFGPYLRSIPFLQQSMSGSDVSCTAVYQASTTLQVVYNPTKTYESADSYGLLYNTAPFMWSGVDYMNFFNGWTVEILFAILCLLSTLELISMLFFWLRRSPVAEIARLKRQLYIAHRQSRDARQHSYRSVQASRKKSGLATAWIVMARKVVQANGQLQTNLNAMQTRDDSIRDMSKKQRRIARRVVKKLNNGATEASNRSDPVETVNNMLWPSVLSVTELAKLSRLSDMRDNELTKAKNRIRKAEQRNKTLELDLAAANKRAVIAEERYKVSDDELLATLQREEKVEGTNDALQSTISDANERLHAAEERLETMRAVENTAMKRLERADCRIKTVLFWMFLLRLINLIATNKQKRNDATTLDLKEQLQQAGAQINVVDRLYRDEKDERRLLGRLIAEFKIEARRFDIPKRIAWLATCRINLVDERDMLLSDLAASNHLRQSYEAELQSQMKVTQTQEEAFLRQITGMQSDNDELTKEHSGLKLEYALVTARKLCVCRRRSTPPSNGDASDDDDYDDDSDNDEEGKDERDGEDNINPEDRSNLGSDRHEDGTDKDGSKKDDDHDNEPGASEDGQASGLSTLMSAPKVDGLPAEVDAPNQYHTSQDSDSSAQDTPRTCGLSDSIWATKPSDRPADEVLPDHTVATSPLNGGAHAFRPKIGGTNDFRDPASAQRSIGQTSTTPREPSDLPLAPPMPSWCGLKITPTQRRHKNRGTKRWHKDNDEGITLPVTPFLFDGPSTLPAYTPTGPSGDRNEPQPLPTWTPKGPREWLSKGPGRGGHFGQREVPVGSKYAAVRPLMNPGVPIFTPLPHPALAPQAAAFTPGRLYYTGGQKP